MEKPQNHNIFMESATAWLLTEDEVKAMFPLRFHGDCLAFPDQLHTFIGDCSTAQQVVALVPQGDVKFSANKVDGLCLIAVVGQCVSASYLEFLEDMQISYICVGSGDLKARLEHDFGITHLQRFNEKAIKQQLTVKK